MTLTYYPEQPRETRYIGFDEKQLSVAKIKHQNQFRKAGWVLLLILAALALIL